MLGKSKDFYELRSYAMKSCCFVTADDNSFRTWIRKCDAEIDCKYLYFFSYFGIDKTCYAVVITKFNPKSFRNPD